MSRIMFAATSSGSGKTTVLCAVLQALKNRGFNIKAFKCGPDYIDSMYHKAIGISSGNLDSFFCNREELCNLLDYEGYSIIEGAMGFYDGLGFTTRASAYEVSQLTKTPVVLIADCRGMANSISALLKGFKEYKPNFIKGVIFNRISEGVYAKMAERAREAGLKPLGYFPYNEDFSFESRHLGLVEPQNLEYKLNELAKQAEKSIEILDIINILINTPELNYTKIRLSKKYYKKVAVAKDEAFSFIYEDNINLLKKYGCEIIYFSPLRDKALPECDRLILSGGYPELYTKRLSENKELMIDIKNKINKGLKTIAECGGFMYLHKELECVDNHSYNMVGVIDGKAYKTDKLQRFGYFNMTALKDNMLCKKDESITVHEFHYWDSSSCGEDFILKKPNSIKEHKAVIATGTFYGGFPHIYFWGNRKVIERFLED